MILQLIWKEWREHWPKAATIFVMYLSFIIACAFADHRHALDLFIDVLTVVCFGVAIFLAMSTITTEERARTRSTLAGLPINPRHVFYIKTLADILTHLAALIPAQYIANACLSRGPNAHFGFPAMAPIALASTALYLWTAVLAIRQRTEIRVILIGLAILGVNSLLLFPARLRGFLLIDEIANWFAPGIAYMFPHSGLLSLWAPLGAMIIPYSAPLSLFSFSYGVHLLFLYQALAATILLIVGSHRYQRLLSTGGAIDRKRIAPRPTLPLLAAPISPRQAVRWKTWRDIRWYIRAFVALAILYPIIWVRSVTPPLDFPFGAVVWWVLDRGLQSFTELVTAAGFVLAALVGVEIGVGDFEGRVPGFWQSRAIDVHRYFTWRYSRGFFAVMLCALLPLVLMATTKCCVSVLQWKVGEYHMYWSNTHDGDEWISWRLTHASEAVQAMLLYFLVEIFLAYNIAVFLGALLRRPIYAMTLAFGAATAIAIFTQDGGSPFTLHHFATGSLRGCIAFNVVTLFIAAAFGLLARMAFTADWLSRIQQWFESQRPAQQFLMKT